ncbi:hypothetical protein FE257_003789 [Aspergillus nanangensis]|uniref:Uncharacterized protein n=1 Tax=Aspergillus nanangensis TaxID=2582783 RepID=A0AAD4CB83_ASPNN|nr:hypothetical protein FE257_003789 [Aspergillus nanangensis]
MTAVWDPEALQMPSGAVMPTADDYGHVLLDKSSAVKPLLPIHVTLRPGRLNSRENIRDMLDTVPWGEEKGYMLNADGWAFWNVPRGQLIGGT